MKSAIYEVVGCIGSQEYREITECDTMKEARHMARERNDARAGMRGKSLREFMRDLNDEGKFFAAKAGLNGWRLQR